jgi:uncharacterized protein (DUF1015 family)
MKLRKFTIFATSVLIKMPDIRPFRGLLYNTQKVKDIAKVLTPPYDVIGPAEQKSYYRMHPYNIIRLILGKEYPQDTNKSNRYTRADKLFRDWQRQKVLMHQEKEGIYIYTQSFLHNNKRRTRTGFIVLLKLEDFTKNTILPHEITFSQPVKDRLRLLKTVQANLSPIFAIFVDSQERVNRLLNQCKKEHPPYIVTEKEKVLHSLWRVNDKGKISAIKKLLKGKQIFIADGHHRYEAALNYKMHMQKAKRRRSRMSAANYIMTYLVATCDRGLAILPTHRAVRNIADFHPDKVYSSLKASFHIRNFSTSEELFSYMLAEKGGCIFGAYFGKHKFCALKLKAATPAKRQGGRKGIGEDLDVTILQRFIIEEILHIHSCRENVYYTRDAQEAIKLVDKDGYQSAFFLRPAKITQVKRIARAGVKMPHKSTYFYPKLLSGLVINSLTKTSLRRTQRS